MSLPALVGFLSLVSSLGMILALYGLFRVLGNGRYVHFRRFFAFQAVAYGAAAVSVLTGDIRLLAVARVFTPISYLYLFWGMTRHEEAK